MYTSYNNKIRKVTQSVCKTIYVVSFCLCVVICIANKGNHHAGKRDVRLQGFIPSYNIECMSTLLLIYFFFVISTPSPCQSSMGRLAQHTAMRFICSCFINITFDFLIQLRDWAHTSRTVPKREKKTVVSIGA